MDYGFTHQGRVFTPNGTPQHVPGYGHAVDGQIPPGDNDARNRALALAELKRWEGRPDHQVGYYRFPAHPGGGLYRQAFKLPCADATVTTWLGTVIGRVTSAKVYRGGFGGRMVYLSVQGTNGAEYWGRASWDGGTCVNLRRVKGRGVK